MSIYMLSSRTKKSISDGVGIPFEEIINLSLDEEIELASKRYGRRIIFSRNQGNRRIRRGNPLPARRKFRTLEDVEKKIERIS